MLVNIHEAKLLQSQRMSTHTTFWCRQITTMRSLHTITIT